MSEKSNEWYTPAKYIEAARLVMGTIDLDPASCELANRTVKATHYYTREDNGLLQQWYGNVWLNPPYGGAIGQISIIEQWIRKMLRESICQAIVLTPVDTDAGWYSLLWDFLICFPVKRIHFYRSDKGLLDSQRQGNSFTYIGHNEQKFIDVFSQFGPIAKQVSPPVPRPYTNELWDMLHV